MDETRWKSVLDRLRSGCELSTEDLRFAIGAILHGQFVEVDAEDFLLALRQKGETAAEVAAAAQAIREQMLCWDPGREDVLDTCGTGGDRSGTFNISTAVAFVLAGAGVRVVKHGNRAVSSNSGSADVLAALGVPCRGDPAEARHDLDRTGLTFCFAPSFHPALKHIAPLRKRLGVPTVFNCIGPLANPAGAPRQLLGVGRRDLLDIVAGALTVLGTKKTYVVHSDDGLDEISLGSKTLVREVRGSEILSHVWQPADFGLEPVERVDILAQDAAASARVILDILEGTGSPAARVVAANAAAGLMAADRVDNLPAGVRLAREAIASGNALRILQRLSTKDAPSL